MVYPVSSELPTLEHGGSHRQYVVWMATAEFPEHLFHTPQTLGLTRPTGHPLQTPAPEALGENPVTVPHMETRSEPTEAGSVDTVNETLKELSGAVPNDCCLRKASGGK